MLKFRFRIDEKAFRQVGYDLDPARIGAALSAAAQDAARDLKKALEENTPVRTGKMKSSWKVAGTKEMLRGAGGARFTIENTQPYASAVDDGAAPRMIYPRNKRALKIPGIGFRAYANWPGFPGRMIVQKAMQQINVVNRVLNRLYWGGRRLG